MSSACIYWAWRLGFYWDGGCYECGLYGSVLYTGPGGWAVAGLVAAINNKPPIKGA